MKSETKLKTGNEQKIMLFVVFAVDCVRRNFPVINGRLT